MHSKKIVFLGNSIVNGFPLKRSQCFVSLYRESTGHNVINKGVNGSTTPEALVRLDQDVLSHRPDEMWFLGGTNDFIMETGGPEATLAGYDELAERCKAAGIAPIFITPLPIDPEMASRLWMPGVDYEQVQALLLDLHKRMLNYGRENDIRIVDIQSRFAALYDRETVQDYLIDGLHPTPLGHQAIARFLLEAE